MDWMNMKANSMKLSSKAQNCRIYDRRCTEISEE